MSEKQNFVLDLMKKREVPIVGALNSPLGQRVKQLFQGDVRVKKNMEEDETSKKQRFPPYLLKEYVIRWCVPRPAVYSRPTPQRMHAYVDLGTEFRLSGAFSEDLTFM